MLPISVAMPGRGHDRPAPPARHGRAAEHHVHAVAEADRLGERRDVLQHRLALAGERRLGDRQRGRLDQPRVRAHRVALGQHRTSPGTTSARDPLPRARRARRRRRRRHPLQRGDRLLGARLLHVAEHGVERR